MSVNVKSISSAADKLVRNAQAGATDYGTNAQAASGLWATNAAAAKANFQQAVTAGNIAERFARGIAKAGATKYAGKVLRLGIGRFSQGVADGKSDYTANAEPYFATISGLTLPARQPRGSAANYQRVTAVGNALNAKRLALLGGAGA